MKRQQPFPPECNDRKVHGLRLVLAAVLAAGFLLGACSPKFDWREVHGGDAPYTVLMPAKPDSSTREIDLGGVRAAMTMTGAEIDGATYAVGTARLPDAGQALAALPVMRDTMVRNIGGKVRDPKTAPEAQKQAQEQAQKQAQAGNTMLEVEAVSNAGGNVRVLHGRFIARGDRVYQAIIVGPENAVPPEAVETFLSSFRVN